MEDSVSDNDNDGAARRPFLAGFLIGRLRQLPADVLRDRLLALPTEVLVRLHNLVREDEPVFRGDPRTLLRQAAERLHEIDAGGSMSLIDDIERHLWREGD